MPAFRDEEFYDELAFVEDQRSMPPYKIASLSRYSFIIYLFNL